MIPDADLKTLRLATLLLTPERVAQYVAYQRHLVAQLHEVAAVEPSRRFSDAHLAALEHAGLESRDFGPLAVGVGAFIANRAPLRRLEERLRELEGKDEEAATRIRKEMLRLRDLGGLERRYGTDAVASLLDREGELLELHHAVNRVQLGR